MDVHTDLFVMAKFIGRILTNLLRQLRLWPRETVIISTSYGAVKGVRRKTIYDVPYYSFEGIPFAKPPIGKLRFREPQPIEAWRNILDCTKAKPKPIQKNLILHFVEGSEDCLYLNIYVNQFEPRRKLPVIVWIHGGGFQIGEASRDLYAPDFFIEREIVFVCITYRMGAFGFASFRDPELNIPGNAALKDQFMALQWIKKNIHNFNGNENNITVLAQSAGAASVHLLMCCERARGLFHKAILLSGTVLCSWTFFPQRNWEYRLACRLGYDGPNNDREVLEFLQTVNSRKIANVHSFLLTQEHREERINAPFGPIIEPYETPHSIITKPVRELLKNAWGNNIPIILGGTTDEALLLYENALKFPYLINNLGNCEALLPTDLQEYHTAEEKKEMGLKLKKAYFYNENPNIEKHMMEYLDLLNFQYFWHGIHRTIQSRLDYAADVPTYVYRFNFDSPNENIYRLIYCGNALRGVIHSSDLAYLFFNILTKKHSTEAIEYKITRNIVGAFVVFAGNSHPNCEEIKPSVWEPINVSKDKFLEIGEKIQVIEIPEKEKLNLWNSFYTKSPLY